MSIALPSRCRAIFRSWPGGCPIGASASARDGLILICPSERADAEMRMFNADGSPPKCAATASAASPSTCTTTASAAARRCKIESAGRVLSLELSIADGVVDRVRVDMGEPILIPEQIPTTLRSPTGPEQPVVDVPLAVGGREFRVTCVSMGNPHCVVFVDEPTDDWVLGIGPQDRSRSALSRSARMSSLSKVLSRPRAASSGLGSAARARRWPAAPARVRCASRAC